MNVAERPVWNRQTYHERIYGVGSATMVPDETIGPVELANFCGVAIDQKPSVIVTACMSEPSTLVFACHHGQMPYEDACISFTQVIGASGTMSIPLVDQETFTHTMTGTEAEPIASSFADDLLDWDFALVAPSSRPSGVVRATLKFAGRSKPIPEDELWGD